MKTKIILTVIILALAMLASIVWDSLESPVAGAADAAQLKDTVESYLVARAIHHHFVEGTIQFGCAVAIGIIWLVTAGKTKH